MSISPLKKVTLIAGEIDKEEFIDGLQTFGCIHLSEIELPVISRTSRVASSLRFLLETPYQRHPVHSRKTFDAENIIEEALSLKERLDELLSEQEFLKKRISKLSRWGDFELPLEESIGNNRLWFYRIPLNKLRDVRKSSLNWAIAHKDHRLAYVVVVADHEPTQVEFPFKRTLTGNKPLSQLQNELEANETEIDELSMRRMSLTRFIPHLIDSLAELETEQAKQIVKSNTKANNGLIQLKGWVEESKLKALHDLTDKHHAVLIVEEISPEDNPPTQLHNPSPLNGGEDLVIFYQTPAYKSWDPSIILFFSFALFFAMIMADAGYSLVIMLIVLLSWKKLEDTSSKQRLRNLMIVIAAGSFIYGAMCNSWFGFSLPGIQGLQLIDIQDHQSMINLSVAIGVMHILLGQFITLWHYRAIRPVATHHAGWIALTLGGFLLWLWYDNSLGSVFAGVVMTIGLLLLLFFPATANEAQLSLKVIALRLMEVGSITKLFGDVLSYLRLFALGLASATLAVTFNDLSAQVYANDSWLSIPAAIFVFILGHTLNFILTIVSGVVHGLRLNFIEFYHWTLSDEGYPFRAFKKMEKTTWNYS